MNTGFKNLEEEIWYEQNYQTGELMGYPKCCIDEFCEQSPEKMKGKKPTDDDVRRYKAAHINGGWTGFIPCAKHAKMILDKKIKLSDLISKRHKDMPPFPSA